MKKKALSLFLVAAMVASMTGCGNNKTEGNSNNAATTTDNKADTEATADASSDDEEEITCDLTVWSPAEDQAEDQGNWLPKMCEQFAAQHPNWHINFTYGVCPEGEAKANVTQDVDAAADVYMYANDNITDLVSNNALAKLGGSALEAVQSTNSQAIIDSVSIDGSVYGFPFTTNTWYMFYDKSVFSDDDIKSLDTMLEKGKVAFPLTNSWYIASFYVANGGTMFGDDQMDESAGIDFSGDKGTQVTDYLVDLAANPNFVNDADGAGIAGLRDGSIKAMFSGSWDAASVKEALGDNMGVAALPTVKINGNDVQMKAFAGSKAIGVNPKCENQQVAIALAQYLASAEAQQAHYDDRGVVPCNTDLLAQDAIQADAVVTAQNDTFDNTSITQPFVAAMSNYWTPAENMGKAIVNGEVTHDNAADQTEKFNTAMNTSEAENATE
ncbi:MAG: extracellular solute-binding protein [Lachnospiraceae bacterium]|nr:extracellular solute-binding protein [Lachnospiraceae bacterium]